MGMLQRLPWRSTPAEDPDYTEDPVPHGAACVPESDQCFCSKAPEWQHGLRSVHLAPRRPDWTAESPTRPGWYWVRFKGSTDYEPIRVEAGFDYAPGRVEWAGPLVEPR